MGFTSFFELSRELTDGIHNLWVVCVCGSSVELRVRYQLHTATDVGLVGNVSFTGAICESSMVLPKRTEHVVFSSDFDN